MASSRPAFSKDPLYQMLRGDDIKGFNAKRAAGTACDLRDVDLRALDLRGMNADGLDMSGAYLRDADIRGIDFSNTRMEGVSLRGARISGVMFPAELGADEIRLSVEFGTRMRYNPLLQGGD
jgi:uncharacterized protein YjbI with pentapeptide repeats